ncbi:MAG TPA: DUF3073 domain-containing protein [Nocardioidaceae bacterium]|jgi:hypothetical protein
MGRGRAKAKQTKVARELKYREFNTDFSALQRELHGDDQDGTPETDDTSSDQDDDEYDDPYADLYDDEDGMQAAESQGQSR